MHYVYPSYAPFTSTQSQENYDISVEDIVKSVIKQENSLCDSNPQNIEDPLKEKINLASCFQFRGDVQPSEVVKSFDSISSEHKFCNYVPTGIYSSI